jgi:hypothetical protein
MPLTGKHHSSPQRASYRVWEEGAPVSYHEAVRRVDQDDRCRPVLLQPFDSLGVRVVVAPLAPDGDHLALHRAAVPPARGLPLRVPRDAADRLQALQLGAARPKLRHLCDTHTAQASRQGDPSQSTRVRTARCSWLHGTLALAWGGVGCDSPNGTFTPSIWRYSSCCVVLSNPPIPSSSSASSTPSAGQAFIFAVMARSSSRRCLLINLSISLAKVVRNTSRFSFFPVFTITCSSDCPRFLVAAATVSTIL